MRRTTLLAALALVTSTGLFGLAGPAAAAGVSCGDTISASVTLTQDLNCSGETLTVEGAGTVLDLDGHAITGAAVLVTGSDVTITSGRVSPSPGAMGPTVAVEGGHLVLAGVRVSGSTDQRGVLVDYGGRADLVRSTVAGFGVGLDLYGQGPNTVTASSFSGNRVGVHVDQSGNTIRGNVFDRNGTGVWIAGGIRGSASVAQNIFSRQSDAAVRVDGSPDPRVAGVGGEIARNWIITGDGAGVSVTAPDGSGPLALSVTGNVLVYNGGDGVSASGPASSLAGVAVGSNFAIANRGRGVDAAGVTDGGRNVALLNRLRPQCVGVVCS